MKLSLLAALAAVVCLAESPFSDAAQHAATAKTVTGDVSVLRDSRKLAVMVGDLVKVKDTVVTGVDGRATFQIADGSTIQVWPNSKFIFRPNAPNWRDLLDLWIGQVRVHIEHLNNKPNPHRMHTPTAAIAVRGTTFEVTVDGDETTLVEVDDGMVEVSHLLLPTGQKREVRAGEAVTVRRDEPIARSRGTGEFFRQVLRMGMDAIVVMGRPGAGGGGGIPGGGGNGPVGDQGPPETAPPTGTGPGAPPATASPGAPPIGASPGLPPLGPPGSF